MKNILNFLIVLLVFSANVFAAETITLENAKKQVVNNNINVAIAYENYVLVKEQEKEKALSLLPNISIDMLILNYQYTILSSLIPEPARFFDVAAQKDLAIAAKINTTIVKKNLLEDLENTMYLYQFHKEVVESLQKELAINTDIASRSKEAYDLGAISFSDFYLTQRNVVASKSQLISANEILTSDAFALKLILQVADNTQILDIENLPFYNETLAFPNSSEEAEVVAVNNAKEIEQFDYLTSAAKKQKRGVAISWISWGGVGFDYFARVSIAKIEVEKIQLNKSKAVFELRNQVSAQYADIAAHKEKISYQDQLLAMAETAYVNAKAQETNLLNSHINTRKAELDLLGAQRDSRKLKYELEMKFIKLKRLLGSNMLTNEVPRS